MNPTRPTHRGAAVRPRRAFSLFEVLLAIALIAALLGSLFSFLWDTLSTRRQLLDVTARERAAATLIDFLERDLAACLAGNQRIGAGVTGDDSTLTILTRAVPVREALNDTGQTALLDLERTAYRFDPAEKDVHVSRSLATGTTRVGGAPGVGLGGGITKIRFRYHDGSAWQDSFDSLRADRLPLAVEVAIWFRPWPGEEDVEPLPSLDSDTDRLALERAFDFEDESRDEFAPPEPLDVPIPDRLRIIAIPGANVRDDGFSHEGDESEDVVSATTNAAGGGHA